MPRNTLDSAACNLPWTGFEEPCMRLAPAFCTAFLAILSTLNAVALAQRPRVASIVGFPPVLEKLGLSGDQRKQIEAIASKQDALFLAAWQDFSQCYQRTLKAESILLAAIEDGFTDAQRQQAHQERGKAIAAQTAPAQVTNQVAKSPATAATPTSDTPPTGVALNAEQVAAAGKLQEKYHLHLGPLARDIQSCHNRMLAIEMEKFLEIQKVLTPGQKTKLSQLLQSGEAANIAGLAGTKAD
jgi:hypothetical protein